MKLRHILACSVSAIALLGGAAGCSVVRDQQPVGSYVDDSVLTTRVKSKLAIDETVSAVAIKVETLEGIVQLSGFAKSEAEKRKAEALARSVSGVVDVKNDIIVKAG